jgi:tRNA 2-thiocytidine biosynthesis protein TtcA
VKAVEIVVGEFDCRDQSFRPMAYVKEADSARYAEVRQFPIIPCDLCGSQENLQRKQIKGLMREWEKKYPGRVESIFSSLSTVVPSHLMDRAMFGFADLKADGEANPLGDIAFDDEPCSTPAPGVLAIQPTDDCRHGDAGSGAPARQQPAQQRSSTPLRDIRMPLHLTHSGPK